MTAKTTAALALSLFAAGCGILSEESEWAGELYIGPNLPHDTRVEGSVPVSDDADFDSGSVVGSRVDDRSSIVESLPAGSLLDSGVGMGSEHGPNADWADLDSRFSYFDADYFEALSDVPFDISYDALTNHLLFGASFRF